MLADSTWLVLITLLIISVSALTFLLIMQAGTAGTATAYDEYYLFPPNIQPVEIVNSTTG